ncbi:antigenic protein A10 [Cryptosporidium felis]|nr:antigenic protein A10 [Cryptosporidium felis]
MEILRSIINIYLRKFLQLEDLKWDLNEGLKIDHVKINNQDINRQLEEKSIPIQISDGSLDSMKVSYSPTNGTFQISIREIRAQIRPKVLSTVGKKIQQGIVNIILDEDPVEFIDSYSYIRDLPISYLEYTNKKVESSIADPALIPEPPRFPVAALRIGQFAGCPPKYYPPLYESSYKQTPAPVPGAISSSLSLSSPMPLEFQNPCLRTFPEPTSVRSLRNKSSPIPPCGQFRSQVSYMFSSFHESGKP